MAMAHDFFRPLGARISAAMTEIDDADLAAAHRVFLAMIDAMTMFEDELVAVDPPASPNVGRGTAARRTRGKARSAVRRD